MTTVKLLYIITTVALVQCKMRGYLTIDELREIFQLSEQRDIEYYLTPVDQDLLEIKNAALLRIKAFEEDYELYLEPNSDILFGRSTSVYLAYPSNTTVTGVKYRPYHHNLDFKVYQDVAKNAALTIEEKNKKLQVNGIIGDYVIRPIPKHLKHVIRKRTSSNSNNVFKGNDDDSVDHVIMKMKQYDSFRRDPNVLLRVYEVLNKLKNIENNITYVYPEILVITDYKTLRDHGSIEQFLKYMVTFWNGVDMKFRSVGKPKIRLNIAGIIIPQNEGCAAYDIFEWMGRKYVLGFESLEKMSTFFFQETAIPHESYDIIVAVTNYDLLKKSNFRYYNDLVGIARTAQACSIDNIRKKVDSVVLVEDDQSFIGVRTAAHELAHSMGSTHDGNDPPLPYVLGSKECLFSDGYLMSSEMKDENAQRWSPCTLRSLELFLTSDRAKCLRNKPQVSMPYPKILPGLIVSLDQQCDAIEKGTVHCLPDKTKNESTCHVLFCMTPGSEICTSQEPALEGSPCYENDYFGICLLGNCKPLPKNFSI